jgi:hypothetical protein
MPQNLKMADRDIHGAVASSIRKTGLGMMERPLIVTAT